VCARLKQRQAITNPTPITELRSRVRTVRLRDDLAGQAGSRSQVVWRRWDRPRGRQAWTRPSPSQHHRLI